MGATAVEQLFLSDRAVRGQVAAGARAVVITLSSVAGAFALASVVGAFFGYYRCAASPPCHWLRRCVTSGASPRRLSLALVDDEALETGHDVV